MTVITQDKVFHELWVSLASLLRSYTAAHGLNGNRQAMVELGEHRITVRHGERWLELERQVAIVNWKREDASHGELELTEDGRLRGSASVTGLDGNDPEEEEMDLKAEAWARELMR